MSAAVKLAERIERDGIVLSSAEIDPEARLIAAALRVSHWFRQSELASEMCACSNCEELSKHFDAYRAALAEMGGEDA